MSLNFPSQPEIRLGKSPLYEVICQLKFAPVLRIANESPTDFQDAIRKRFPGLKVEQGVMVQLPGAGGSENLSIVNTAPKIYRFLTLDGKTNLALTIDFLALATDHYSHWGDFVADLLQGTSALEQTYQPAVATRIGLRFINRFTRKNTGCKSAGEILDLVRSELTCLIRADAWKEPLEMLSQIVLKDKQAKLAIRSGFGRENGEPFFLLDFDYYEEGQLPLDNLGKRVDRYHTRIYDAFRWSMQPGSLDRFNPLS